MSEIERSFIMLSITLVLLVLYFRFFFGYFIRNFERQADLYCFHSGVSPYYLLSSFRKLAAHIGDDAKKPNWHHYNIPQRIEFIEKCIESPERIYEHDRKVKRIVKRFTLSLVAFAAFMLYPIFFANIGGMSNLQQFETYLQQKLMTEPENYQLYTGLGEVSFQLEKWEQTRSSYEASLKINYRQPSVLNNLAWLYLTCPEKGILNHRRALALAKDAIKLNQAPHIFDTLAEAYFKNSMYEKAYIAAKEALDLAKENVDYYRSQLKKMEKHYSKFKSSINI
jgi:tetratricopeptide (TPR) repeat protein